MTAAKLAIDALSCSFDGAAAVESFTLSLTPGEFVSIVGPSGCGKSTVFNAVSGLITPAVGNISVDGHNVTGTTGHVGYMLQKDLLVPWRTVVGNIVLHAALTRGVTRDDVDEARDIARRYGLGDFLDHYPHALSGGMRQRVALMRTLATHNDVLLLDEPFGALDSQTRLDMQQWLLEVWQATGKTVLFVTHDVDEALFLSDRVVVMTPRPGRIAAELAVDLPRPRTVDMLTSPEFITAKRGILDLLHVPGGVR